VEKETTIKSQRPLLLLLLWRPSFLLRVDDSSFPSLKHCITQWQDRGQSGIGPWENTGSRMGWKHVTEEAPIGETVFAALPLSNCFREGECEEVDRLPPCILSLDDIFEKVFQNSYLPSSTPTPPSSSPFFSFLLFLPPPFSFPSYLRQQQLGTHMLTHPNKKAAAKERRQFDLPKLPLLNRKEEQLVKRCSSFQCDTQRRGGGRRKERALSGRHSPSLTSIKSLFFATSRSPPPPLGVGGILEMFLRDAPR
jgi:hypothetical protein